FAPRPAREEPRPVGPALRADQDDIQIARQPTMLEPVVQHDDRRALIGRGARAPDAGPLDDDRNIRAPGTAQRGAVLRAPPAQHGRLRAASAQLFDERPRDRRLPRPTDGQIPDADHWDLRLSRAQAARRIGPVVAAGPETVDELER